MGIQIPDLTGFQMVQSCPIAKWFYFRMMSENFTLCPVFGGFYIQWGSDIWTYLAFEWSNGLDF